MAESRDLSLLRIGLKATKRVQTSLLGRRLKYKEHCMPLEPAECILKMAKDGLALDGAG
jgi:hypothetical protein